MVKMTPYGKVQFERRVFPRFQLEIPVTYQVIPGSGASGNASGAAAAESAAGNGTTGNISLGGLQLRLPDRVQVGDRLQLRMYLTDPTGPRRIQAAGHVVWVEADSGSDQVKAGLAFDEIDPEDKTYLEQFQTLWLEQSL
jgi:c-di-GMP-binding flagellar brake protein YcgR